MIKKKIIKNTIDHEILIEGFYEETKLIGIICPIAYYTFVSQINQKLAYDFKRDHELEVEYNQNYFSVYSHFDKLKNIESYLYVNRSRTEYLINESPKMDFIWLLKGNSINQKLILELTTSIRKMNGVINCFAFDSALLKNRELLII
ncbi:MAG: IPExxxVDY family protein [Chitinophagaceae bacterium]|nr:MAG: hypothetical protein UZ11_BCD004000006 [Bacteroidetes bacterium OLB11]MCC6447340.1 IPExxxVDY family protein [Chitinophagaceae bacterium]HMN31811.1 IPExxxVDY family protein [Chitinophagaceae bacterium]